MSGSTLAKKRLTGSEAESRCFDYYELLIYGDRVQPKQYDEIRPKVGRVGGLKFDFKLDKWSK